MKSNLNLKELEDKLDKALEAETSESLNEFINTHRRINPCKAHAFSDEGAESLEELNIELPNKCIHNEDIWLCHETNQCKECINSNELPLKCLYHKDYNLCSCKNICEQCKID